MTDFDLRVISLGAGVQSTCMYLMACDGELGPCDAAIFADTQDESKGTYEWLAKLEEVGTIPILRRTAGSLSEEVIRSMQETKSGFCPIPTYVVGDDGNAQLGRRQCTRSHKTNVVYQAVRELLGLKPRQRTSAMAQVWIGISTDEAHRAKPSRYPIIEHRWPLLFDAPKRRGDCAAYTDIRGLGVPPKSSCVYCPFHSEKDWSRMKRNDPESFATAVNFEQRLLAIDGRQHLHKSCVPLGKVEFNEDDNLDLFGNECEGMCGI